MPTFSNSPPADLGRSGYRLIRTPPAHALQGYVLSDNLIGCPTHFINNRTIPCEAPDCESCENGVGWRWHGYVLVVLAETQEVVIFECTARASQSFADYHARYGTLRGAAFKAQRLNARANGRVMIQTKPADLTKINLPQELSVQKLLCHIWNIAPNQVVKPTAMNRPPFHTVNVDRTQPETPVQPTEPDPDNLLFPTAAGLTPSKNGEEEK